MATIDLNADAGEDAADEAALFTVVSSANVAAGAHAGGGLVLTEAVRLAAEAGVAVGAHPSYPDRPGFGRASMAAAYDRAGLAALVREQVLTVAAACAGEGIPLSHVKAHGALYHDCAADPVLAEAVRDAVVDLRTDLGWLPLVGMPGSALERACLSRDVRFVPEAFADRGYAPDGSLVARRDAGGVLQDADVVAERVLRLATEGVVTAVDGTVVRIHAQTVCLHGDTPGAVAMARRIRHRLEEHAVRIAPVGAHR